MSLPKWVQRFGPGSIVHCDDARKVDMRVMADYEKTVKALEIAWEALDKVREACNDDYCCCERGEKPHKPIPHSSDHCSGYYAVEALRHIEELGK